MARTVVTINPCPTCGAEVRVGEDKTTRVLEALTQPEDRGPSVRRERAAAIRAQNEGR